MCAARELAREEIRRAVPAIKRIDTPLFAREDGEAWRHTALADTFERMLKVVVGPERVKHYSMHSWRIYLACASAPGLPVYTLFTQFGTHVCAHLAPNHCSHMCEHLA